MKQLKQKCLELIFICLLSGMLPSAVADQYSDEAPLFKAAYIYNFARLTAWPLETWESQDMPFQLCTLGRDEVVDALASLQGKKIRGRSIEVRELKSAPLLQQCQLLYIVNSKSQQPPQIIEIPDSQALLTVSEIPGFTTMGGIIELHREDKSTRFKINLGEARKRRLEISSRLLSLAIEVQDRAQR